MQTLATKSIRALNGVGEKRRVLFEKLGVFSIKDLLYYFPRSYNDMTQIFSINDAPLDTNCCIKVRATSSIWEQRVRAGMIIRKTIVSDSSGALTLTAFNNRFAFQKLRANEEFFIFGKIKANTLNKREMIAPTIFSKDEINGLMPIYRAAESLSSKQIEQSIKQALLLLTDGIDDTLPNYIKEKYSLCDIGFALNNIHFPQSFEALQEAKKRLVFEEFLILRLALNSLKLKNKVESSFRLSTDHSEEFYKLLPFEPTNAQQKAVNDCVHDIMGGTAMNRLIQGDVGSGKTLVAAALAYNVAKEKAQAAVMAPTEILAEQHFHYFKNLFNESDLKIELVSGATPKKLKQRIKDNLMLGNIDIIIGTHALLTDDVVFANLGLVITDEQHRFGVAQREKLYSKGHNPHTVVMSATPIPRSLALVIYGDLEISVIDEMPKGRQKTDTFLIDGAKRERALNFITKAIDEGHQAYIVCPLIDENDESELACAQETFNKLSKQLESKYRVGLLHGKMNSFDKNFVMASFLNKEIDILVSTTVIEVGIDNPNAVIIMIENAERLGLSQLHQLRGRVGRGTHKSYCILVSDCKNEDSINRLKIIKSSGDGFIIANEDLKVRGPGDFFGTRQHGLPKLKCSQFLNDFNILEKTKSAADIILKHDPTLGNLENAVLVEQIKNISNIIC